MTDTDDEVKPNWPLAIAKVGVSALATFALVAAALVGLVGTGMGVAACQDGGKADNCVGDIALLLLAVLILTAGAVTALLTAKRSYDTFVVWTTGLASLTGGAAAAAAVLAA